MLIQITHPKSNGEINVMLLNKFIKIFFGSTFNKHSHKCNAQLNPCELNQHKKKYYHPTDIQLNNTLTLVFGTIRNPILESTRLAPASDRYPWFGMRHDLPKQHGQHNLCIHLVHFGFNLPYGSSSFGLNTPIIFWKIILVNVQECVL